MDLPAVDDDVFVLAHPDYFNRVLVADVDAFRENRGLSTSIR